MEAFKKTFYLILAKWFALWARLALAIWKPEIVVISGSSGKTSLFYLLEAQLGERAEFAHDANSAYGIPFDILGLERHSYALSEWPWLFLQAPFKITNGKKRRKIYVVEADAERPGEAEFIQKLLRPQIVAITNVYQTHALFFDKLVAEGKYPAALPAIADEFVKYLRGADKLALINADSQPLFEAVERAELADAVRAHLVYLQAADYLRSYQVTAAGTEFDINGQKYVFPYLLPREMAVSIEITRQICEALGVRIRRDFDNYYLPPGRSSVLRGVKNTTLVDSTYNANYGSAVAMLDAFQQFPGEHKWLVLGEFRDQGREARGQHEALAQYIIDHWRASVEMVVLISPEMQEWVYPQLRQWLSVMRVQSFTETSDAGVWIKQNLKGGETILLKGSQGRHLEGIVEGLLADQADVAKLPRRKDVFRAKQEETVVKMAKVAL